MRTSRRQLGAERGAYINVMKEFKKLKEQYGAAAAKELRETRKTQEESKGADGTVYWMVHPDFPENEDCCCVLACPSLPVRTLSWFDPLSP